MIKVVVTDMDGTLLNSRHVISNKNLEAIKWINKKNIDFVIATGRSYYEAIKPLKEANLKADLICFNGGIVYDKEGNVLNIEKIQEKEALFVISILKKLDITYYLYTKNCTYTENVNTDVKVFFDLILEQGATPDLEEIIKDTKEKIKNGFLVEVENMLEYINIKENPLIKIIALCTDTKKLEEARKLLSENEEITITSSGKRNLEILNKNATKGIALKNLLKEKKISLDETMTIGDNLNDLSMIEIANYSVAMKNANQTLKDNAKYITQNNNDNSGVGEIIIKLVSEINGEKYE